MAVGHRTGDMAYNNRGSMKVMAGIPTIDPGEMANNSRGSMSVYGQTAYTLTITTASPLPGGVVGTPYSQSLATTGGNPSYTYAVTAGSLPTSLNLSSGGVISGTPTVAAVFNFTVTVTDADGNTGTKAMQITITSSGTVIVLNPQMMLMGLG